MRYCLFFCAISFGFLALIAFSWHAPGAASAPPATTAAEALLFQPTRAPASLPATSLAEIRHLEECYRSQSCDVPHADALAYRRSVSEALAVALAEHLGTFGPDASLARSAVQNPEPIVQAVGLRMLSALPASGESLSAIANGLRDSTDPALVAGSMQELRRYLGTNFEADAQRIVEELVGYGAISGASQAPTLVSPFINEHSYDEFRGVLTHLDSGADAARLLRSALEQYETRRLEVLRHHQGAFHVHVGVDEAGHELAAFAVYDATGLEAALHAHDMAVRDADVAGHPAASEYVEVSHVLDQEIAGRLSEGGVEKLQHGISIR